MAIGAQMRSLPDERPAGSAARSTLTSESLRHGGPVELPTGLLVELRCFAFDGYEACNGVLAEPDRNSMLRRRVLSATEPACVMDQLT